MKKNIARKKEDESWIITKKILGIFLIVVGVLGLFLPLLQGILFILIGLALLKNKSIKEYFLIIKKKAKKLN